MKSNTKIIISSIILILVMILIISIFYRFRSKPYPSESITEQQMLVSQIEEINRKLRETDGDIKEIFISHMDPKPSNIEDKITTLSIGDKAKDYLRELISTEESIEYEDMVRRVMQKDDEILMLRRELSRLSSMLPQPDIVQRGDNHYDLAMRFLTDQKGLPPREAQRLVERVALLEHLIPGFIVYHFYDGFDYGTSVIQGDAEQSPNYVRERFFNKLIKEKNEAIEKHAELYEELQELNVRKTILQDQIAVLHEERSGLLTTLDQIRLLGTEKDIMLSSLYFYAGTVSDLRNNGIISVPLFGRPKLRDINPIMNSFTTFDLDKAERIIIEAKDLNIDRINRIHILPDIYEQGKDYKINLAPDKSVFEIIILDKDRFKLERLIIAIQ